jgi:hypothetical protein
MPTSGSPWGDVWVWVLPVFQELLRLLQQLLCAGEVLKLAQVHIMSVVSPPNHATAQFPSVVVALSCPSRQSPNSQERFERKDSAHPLQSRIGDIAIRLEQGPDVERLAAPEVTVHGPVEGELQ